MFAVWYDMGVTVILLTSCTRWDISVWYTSWTADIGSRWFRVDFDMCVIIMLTLIAAQKLICKRLRMLVPCITQFFWEDFSCDGGHLGISYPFHNAVAPAVGVRRTSSMLRNTWYQVCFSRNIVWIKPLWWAAVLVSTCTCVRACITPRMHHASYISPSVSLSPILAKYCQCLMLAICNRLNEPAPVKISIRTSSAERLASATVSSRHVMSDPSMLFIEMEPTCQLCPSSVPGWF